MTPNQLIDDYFESNFSISFGIIMSLSAPLASLSHRQHIKIYRKDVANALSNFLNPQ